MRAARALPPALRTPLIILKNRKKMPKAYDLVVIGGGPAALSAVLYGARLGLNLIAYERKAFGGALSQIARISNFPGFDGPGLDLGAKIKEQAVESGAQFAYGECTDIRREEKRYRLMIDDEVVLARSVLIATGSEPRSLDIKVDVPVSYCALCDADLAKGKNVAVIGGGNSAAQESLVLSPIVEHITLLSRSKMRASINLQKRMSQLNNINVVEEAKLSSELLNGFDQIFVFIGHQPATSCLGSLEKHEDILDKEGYIQTGFKDRSPHGLILPGLYAAGDVRSGSVRQAITAAADGVEAVLEIAEHLK